MRTSDPGDVAPTVAHCVWLPAPQGGRIFAWGGPAKNCGPHALALRVVDAPRGGEFLASPLFENLGRPGEKLLCLAHVSVAWIHFN